MDDLGPEGGSNEDPKDLEEPKDLTEEEKKEERKRDKSTIKGKYTAALLIYDPLCELKDDLIKAGKRGLELKEATSAVMTAMMRPLKTGEDRESVITAVFASLSCQKPDSIKELIDKGNIESGIPQLLDFYKAKYARIHPDEDQKAFIDGLENAHNAVTTDKGKEGQVKAGEDAEKPDQDKDKWVENRNPGDERKGAATLEGNPNVTGDINQGRESDKIARKLADRENDNRQ